MSVVYLLHFETPIGGPRHFARHYLGTALDLDARLAEHRAGIAAAITAHCVSIGVSFVVARTWPGGRRLERRLKRQKKGPRLCPLCTPPRDPAQLRFRLT